MTDSPIKLLRQEITVPDGKSGAWKVARFTVSKNGSAFSFIRDGGRGVRSGEYVALKYRGRTIMSNTDAEIRDHYEPVRSAMGRCLINGLGLGVVLQAVLSKPEVDHVTVIENSEDVIKLVAGHYLEKFGSERLEIVHADAFEYKPPKGVRYGMVWHDIWPSLCTDNLKEMAKLHRKYGRRCDWQGSWGKKLLQDRKRQEDKRDRYNRALSAAFARSLGLNG